MQVKGSGGSFVEQVYNLAPAVAWELGLQVCREMQVPNTYVPDVNDRVTMCAFAAAISQVENGVPAVTADVEAGWELL